MTPSLREQFAQKFDSEYHRLNAAQKHAVDCIYGPVMVVAGPGTGKTQMLALRVCKILVETDADASNLLCLTFTDAGTVAMRNRLLGIMGPDANKVNIYTFHGFCNKIIRENPEYFGDYFDLQNADEVELRETIAEMMQGLPLDHVLRRNTGNQLYDLKRYERVFSAMKQEEWSAEMIEQAYLTHAELLPGMEDFQYKTNYKGNKKGDPKTEAIKTELKKYDFVRNAAPLIEVYQQLLLKKERLDFNDSILWVVKALKTHEALKLRYQEQYQFVLADEYQDTNGVQNDILFLLSDYDGKPNLFVVGDDDQAIYRFQGANLHNITTFIEKYDPELVVLDVNYRSRQNILDSALQLIENNQERLSGLNKKLKAGRVFEDKNTTVQPTLKLFKSPGAMELGLVQEIEALKKSGVDYRDIAVIYRNHKDAEPLIQYYTKAGIPLNVKKRIDVLQQPEIKRILHLMEFVEGEMKYPDAKKHLLFEIMHYDFWGLDALDIGKIAIHASRSARDENEGSFLWRDFLKNEAGLQALGVQKVKETMHCATVLELLIGSVVNHTSQVMLEKIITETGMMDHILRSGNSTWRLQLVNRFFDYIKDLTSKAGELSMGNILMAIEKRQDFEVELAYNSIVIAEDGINFVSAHGSKGLEFPYVFILNATKKSWLDKPSENTKFPPTLFRKAGDSNDEDERRLFYVAMTRAEKSLTILTSLEDQNGKNLDFLPFLSELGYDFQGMQTQVSDQNALDLYLSKRLSEISFKPSLIDQQAIDAALVRLEMNATGVSKFLHCPVTFYFENILRVPSARKPAPGYGNAIHFALEKFFLYWNDHKTDSVPPLETLLLFFDKGMEKFRSHFTEAEFTSHHFEGKKALTLHYQQQNHHWNTPRQHRVELKIKSDFEGIPITGIIDRLSQYDDRYEVYDYKTGKSDSGKFTKASEDDIELGKNGGDYWRQAVFYRLLTERQNEGKGRFGGAVFQFISADEEDAKIKSVEVSGEDMQRVGNQIRYVYNKIKAHDFDAPCNDCHWCQFVAEEMGMDAVNPDYTDEDRSFGELPGDEL
ncbi:MAG TPA: ATP-dependent DNA helicase [Saprospiraceae bacterium]|nr:ATP-dependent DNA helicase [Saprospiraceae bacterium]